MELSPSGPDRLPRSWLGGGDVQALIRRRMQVGKLPADQERVGRTGGPIAQNQGTCARDGDSAGRFGNSVQYHQPLRELDADRVVRRLLVELLVRQSLVRARPGAG